jgi:nicotinate phosphoribosyltransferase
MRREPPHGFVTRENMALLTDLYEFTMAAAYHEHRPRDVATFDLFVRKLPAGRAYLVFAGLERILSYLEHLTFSADAIRFLHRKQGLSARFLSFLQKLRFRGDVDAMPEGTICFPNEPVLRVTANIVEAQIVETFLLNAVTLATAIASKASRIVGAAQGRPVVEFGLRRAHGMDAGLQGARAAYVGGCRGTSNVLAGETYGIPIYGTMAHAFVQSFPAEIDAFRAFVHTFPDRTTLLIDTYDTVEGAKRAARVAQELRASGGRLGGVRLDSGDLGRLSRQVRKILDDRGLKGIKIFASGNLDEDRLAALMRGHAPIDAFGVGADLSVSADAPSLDAVYKLAEVVHDGGRVPTMKLSADKRTFPGRKQVFRVMRAGRMIADYLALEDERMPGRPLLQPVMRRGRSLQPRPMLDEIQRYAARQRAALPPGLLLLHGAPSYPVRTSPGLRRLIQTVEAGIRRHNVMEGTGV